MNTLPDWFLREPAPGPGTPVLEVAALWGDWLLDVRHVPLDADLSIGEGGLPGPVDDLLLDGGEILVPRGCAAEVRVGDRWGPFQGGDVVSGERVVVRTAGFRWLIRQVPPGTKLPLARQPERDHGLWASLAIAGFMAVMLWVVAVTAPPSPEVTVEELSDHFVEVLLREPEPPRKVVEVPSSAPEDKVEGAAAKRKEGKRGQRDGKLRRAMEQRRSDRQVADGAGFMDAINSRFGEMFSATGVGGGALDALGGLEGPRSDRQFGTGLGWDGDGPGGGGEAEGLVGGTGTTGRGGDGSSLSGGGPTGKKREGNLRKGGQVIQIGNMDAALIDQVVKQHLNQYRYCYQRELQKNHALSGKVTLKWVIASDGSVSTASVKRETLGNAAVTGCLLNVARRMHFPQPKGGIVIVSYPFLFSPG